MKRSVAVLAGVAMALALSEAQAQQYPQRPVSLVVPFPPGAATDAFARVIADRMTKALGQQMVVMNRDGAAGIIGADSVVRAAPDGYTLLWGTSSALAIMPALGRKMPFDPQRDLAPVSLGAKLAYVLVVHPSLPVKTVKELIAFAKARPGKLNFASAGIGGAPHLSAELFKTMAGIDIVHVPYRGTALFAADLVAGQVELAFASPVTTLPFTSNGRLRPLAVTTSTPVDAYPDLPTMAEAGLPGYELTQWYAMLAPAKTPPEILGTLNGAIRKALADAEVRRRITSEGGMPSPTYPGGTDRIHPGGDCQVRENRKVSKPEDGSVSRFRGRRGFKKRECPTGGCRPPLRAGRALRPASKARLRNLPAPAASLRPTRADRGTTAGRLARTRAAATHRDSTVSWETYG